MSNRSLYSVNSMPPNQDTCNAPPHPPKKVLYSVDTPTTATRERKPTTPDAATSAAPPAEPEAPNAYHITPGWIDASKRTRTWVLRDCHSTHLCQICSKRDAQAMADLLNNVAKVLDRVLNDERERAR